MRLILVRHGQSEWNAERRLQGQADVALSELGRKQAAALRPIFAQLRPSRTIASDLARTRETAEIMGAAPVQLSTALREIDVGQWTGRTIAALTDEDAQAYAAWRAGRHTPPLGESWEDFCARTTNAVEQARAQVETLLIVSHGGVIRALLQRYLGLDPTHIIPVAPASLTALALGNADSAPNKLELFNFTLGRLEFAAPD